jgi:hypothetical protein
VEQESKTGPEETTDISEFLGQWTLAVDGGGVGWIEIKQETDYLDGSILWRGGTIKPVTYMYLNGNVLVAGRSIEEVVRETDTEGNAIHSQMIPTWMKVKKEGEKLAGYYISPRSDGMGLNKSAFTGTLLPDVGPAPDLSAVKFGEPITLFNGKDLTGWTLVEPNKENGWYVEDGVLINDPVQPEDGHHISYGNLRTDEEFEDFNITLETNVPEGSNSGVYLQGRYEVQVSDSYGQETNDLRMGAIFSRIAPSESAEKPAGTWQTMDITLCDRHVTVILNGTKIIDNQPLYGPTGGALTSDVFAPGPIYLQGDHRAIKFRNIVLTPIVKQ